MLSFHECANAAMAILLFLLSLPLFLCLPCGVCVAPCHLLQSLTSADLLNSGVSLASALTGTNFATAFPTVPIDPTSLTAVRASRWQTVVPLIYEHCFAVLF